MTVDQIDYSDEEDLGWCLDCGDTFRYDDCGGYNPPCRCGMNCRSCCDHHCEEGERGDHGTDCETADD